MTSITHLLSKSAMCLQTQAWSRGFAIVNSIPGGRLKDGMVN
jgi:hypothetical protein